MPRLITHISFSMIISREECLGFDLLLLRSLLIAPDYGSLGINHDSKPINC